MNFGDLRRTTPIGTKWGYDRGNPLDRRYIEDFLARHATDVRGRVLEIGDNAYTVRFGGDAVTHSDVFNRHPGHPQTTLTGDLADPGSLPGETFDCIILTQTIHLIFEMSAAIRNLHRALRPEGVLLATAPYICPIERGGWEKTWFWSLTPAALSRLLGQEFGEDEVTVDSYGNVLAATAFLYGLAEQDLTPDELDARDPHLPVTVVGRARRHAAAP